MDIASSSVSKDGESEKQLKNCQPLLKCTPSNPFAVFGIWVSKSARDLSDRACFTTTDGPASRRFSFFNRLEKSSVLLCSCGFSEEGELGMEGMVEKRKGIEGARDGSDLNNREKVRSFTDSVDEESSETSMSEPTTNEEMCPSSSASSSPRSAWLIQKAEKQNCSISHMKADPEKNCFEDGKPAKQSSKISEIEMMKERFAKLLLGEDMSGSGQGVCTALAISNAITNLCATLFGQLWRLEPLTPEKKSMWQREMQMLLCVSDHIVEFIPAWQNFPDGRKVEVMTCQPRSDLYINLPALRKLDNMLLDILDSFSKAEFWYADQGILAPESDGSTSFRRSLQRQEKWWLPVPSVPSGGLDGKSRKHLEHKRECTSQILKAAMAINNNALAEMEVPESYLENLPKYGRASLGDVIHRYITSDQFNPECLLDCLDLSSEHQALEFANRVEASIYIWRRRTYTKPINNVNRFNSKSSWEMVKDFVIDSDKRDLLADRAEGLLLCLKQRFPGLPQTALDTSKIQFNKDVGKSILEAYSRVLESIAFNIVARIDDLLYTDNLAKHSDQFSPIPKVIPQKRLPLPYSVPVLSTPYKTASATPSFSPAPLVSPAIGERLPLINGKSYNRGFSVKKVLTDYLGVEVRGKNISNAVKNSEVPPS